jgi:mannose-6-phosphate isomerase-like protein (cupin superfamily)
MSVRAEVVLRGEQTAGTVSAIEITVAAGWAGPPLHHHAFDEAWYILEGTLTFQLGDELVEAGPNTLVFAPGDATHTVANLGERDARYVLLCTPAGFERAFDREPRGPIPDTIVVGPPLGERLDVLQPRALPSVSAGINVLVRDEDSAGRIAVMDNAVAADLSRPALHHHEFDELFYVLEGELTFQLGSEVVTRRAGELAFVKRGIHHRIANLSGAPARQLVVCTPAGFERYFARVAAQRQGIEPPAWALQPLPEVTTVGPR